MHDVILRCWYKKGRDLIRGLSPLTENYEFFRREMVYSSVFLMHSACHSKISNPQNENIILFGIQAPEGAPCTPWLRLLVHKIIICAILNALLLIKT